MLADDEIPSFNDMVFTWHNAFSGFLIGLALGGGTPLGIFVIETCFRPPLQPGQAYCGMASLGLLIAIPLGSIAVAILGAGIGGLVDVQQSVAEIHRQRNGE